MTLRVTIAHLITSSFIHSSINNATMNPNHISSHPSYHSLHLFLIGHTCPYISIQLSGIPLLELANDRKYKGNPDYLRYKTETPLLFPLPRLFKVHTHHLLLERSQLIFDLTTSCKYITVF